MSEPTPKIRVVLSDMAAWDDVITERLRQVEAEGWSFEHDDKHDAGCMALAAAAYAANAALGQRGGVVSAATSRVWDLVVGLWPWDWTWWKPKDPRRDLVRAGALILAEIERLDRADRARSIGEFESETERLKRAQRGGL